MADINLNLLQEEILDINAYIHEIKNKINESTLLLKGDFSKYQNLNGDFDDAVWVINSYIHKTFKYIEFSSLEGLEFIGIRRSDIDLIKCWVAENLLQCGCFEDETNVYITSKNALYKYSNLVEFIKVSNNFSEEFVDDSEGQMMREYFNSMGIPDKSKSNKVNSILGYLRFICSKNNSDEKNVIDIYISNLITIHNNLNIEKAITFLPDSKDIFLYDHYVKDFFMSEDTPIDLKNFYYPIWIWWKITNVIPIRISEFCVKIKRDCLSSQKGCLYLSLDRIKRNKTSKPVLPLLKDFKINSETYKLIQEYINKSKEYGFTKTLISYKALHSFRDVAMKTNKDIYTLNCNNIGDKKIDTNHFTAHVFSALLNSFNKTIIKKYYKDSYIENFVKANDTRHFAFTSLMLQGISPEKIAIYGGHSTLDTLDQYTCSSNTYINTEVITIIRKNISEETIDRTSLKKLVFNMPEICPNTKKGFTTDFDGIELGRCTADFSNDMLSCENDDCTKCSKWWCSPTVESYNTLMSIMMKRLSEDVTKLERDIKFIKKLFKEASLVNVDDKVFVEKQAENTMRSTSLRIDARARKIIDTKLRLIDDETKNKLRQENKETLMEAIISLQDTDDFIDEIREKGIIQKGDM